MTTTESTPAGVAGKIPTIVQHKPFAWTFLVLSLIGFLASFTLVLERLELFRDAKHVASCDFGLFVSCTGVMQSEQASLIGTIPNPIFGIVLFAMALAVGVALLAGGTFKRWFWWLAQLAVTAGVGLVVFFWDTSVNVLYTLCPWCMVVWSVTIPLFLIVTTYNTYHGHLSSKISAGIRSALTGWWWVALVLSYVGIIASILFRFKDYFFHL